MKFSRFGDYIYIYLYRCAFDICLILNTFLNVIQHLSTLALTFLLYNYMRGRLHGFMRGLDLL